MYFNITKSVDGEWLMNMIIRHYCTYAINVDADIRSLPRNGHVTDSGWMELFSFGKMYYVTSRSRTDV